MNDRILATTGCQHSSGVEVEVEVKVEVVSMHMHVFDCPHVRTWWFGRARCIAKARDLLSGFPLFRSA